MKLWFSVTDWSDRKAPKVETDHIIIDTKQGRFTIDAKPDGGLTIRAAEPTDHRKHTPQLAFYPRSGNVVDVGFEPTCPIGKGTGWLDEAKPCQHDGRGRKKTKKKKRKKAKKK